MCSGRLPTASAGPWPPPTATPPAGRPSSTRPPPWPACGAGARSRPPSATTVSFPGPTRGRRVADGALIVQSDRSVLLEVDHPRAEAARVAIAPFAELEKSPEHVHTYRLSPLALWNARAAGLRPEQVTAALVEHSRYPVPPGLLADLEETMGRYGRLVLQAGDAGHLVLASADHAVVEEVVRARQVAPLLGRRLGPGRVEVPLAERGRLKQALLA